MAVIRAFIASISGENSIEPHISAFQMAEASF
jgi:hypothetical protein